MSYLDDIKRIKELSLATLDYLSKSKSRRLALVAFGGFIFGSSVLGGWALWDLSNQEQIRQSRQDLHIHRVIATSNAAVEKLKLCANAKQEKSVLAKPYCEDAKLDAIRATNDINYKQRIESYLQKDGYLMAAALINNNVEHEKLTFKEKQLASYEEKRKSLLRWMPASVALAILSILGPYIIMYFRVRLRKAKTWQAPL